MEEKAEYPGPVTNIKVVSGGRDFVWFQYDDPEDECWTKTRIVVKKSPGWNIPNVSENPEDGISWMESSVRNEHQTGKSGNYLKFENLEPLTNYTFTFFTFSKFGYDSDVVSYSLASTSDGQAVT